MKDNSSKVLLVGPSYKIADYDLDYFENKRREGYKILSYTGSILYFREIGFAPDYFSWFDPTSVELQPWRILTDDKGFFKNTDMLVADLYRNATKTHKKDRLYPLLYRPQETFRKITEELPKFFNKCHWHKVRVINKFENYPQLLRLEEKYEHLLKTRPRKARELQKKIREVNAQLSVFYDHQNHGDFKKHLHLYIEKAATEDKLTSFFLPLVLYHFGDSLNEIKVLGFGDLKERDRKGEKRELEPYRTGDIVPYSQDQHDQFIRSFKFLFNRYYSDYLQKEKISLSFENENSYSRIVEEVRH